MLMQTLCAQGAGVDWHDRLPDGAHGKDKNANQKWSAYIKRIHTRPGGRKKRLDERPDVAPLDHSAILRHHGVLPTRTASSRACSVRRHKLDKISNSLNLISLFGAVSKE
jgi:hypothetical protein